MFAKREPRYILKLFLGDNYEHLVRAEKPELKSNLPETHEIVLTLALTNTHTHTHTHTPDLGRVKHNQYARYMKYFTDNFQVAK